jgi:FKBP-type peptidyl-prolyl cis-trans isomerase
MRGISLLFISLGCLACTRSSDDKPANNAPAPASTAGSGSASSGSATSATRPRGEQVAPPVDVKTPPADATRTASGLIYKKLVANDAGTQIRRNDTVQIHYTGWRKGSGETFFTNRGRDNPMPLNLTQAAPGFVEAMQLMRKGEKAMLWIPPEIGYKTPPSEGKPETLVYEVEVVDIASAPAIPDDVAGPPEKAQSLPSGIKLIVLRPGTGKDKARTLDTVTFNYSAWDSEGRMVDTTEMRKRAVTAPVYKQAPALADVVMTMIAGERVRFWVDAEKMVEAGKPVGGVTRGVLCYELEVLQIARAAHEAPPPPPDVAKPPEGTKRTAKGVYYRVLKSSGKPDHPTADDTVKVHYSGWTTDGRMFDSSYVKGEPAQFHLSGTIPGWIDGIPVMAVGDRVRFWVPVELAYAGAPGKPEGMLVFDVELVAIVPKAPH